MSSTSNLDGRLPECATARRTARFWAKVDKAHDCWIWTASRNRNGYGVFSIGGGKVALAHRQSYELSVGPIPAGLTLDHLCRNRACVNPSHLEPVTLQENHSRRRDLATHCPAGHELNSQTKRVNQKTGYYTCRPCSNAATARYRARKRQVELS